MAARFTSMRSVLGVPEYGDILGRHGYREVTNIPSLEKARDVYRMLVDAFRAHFREAKRTLGNAEYVKILRELRLNPKAKLNPTRRYGFSTAWRRLSMPDSENGCGAAVAEIKASTELAPP